MKKGVPIVILLLALGILLASGLFVWFGCRVEPGNGEVAVMIRKTGKDLPDGAIIAPDDSRKGIRLEVLGEGRYFFNPYTYDWKIVPITDIPAGKFAVLVRRFGRDAADGSIIAPDDNTKGVVREVLGTGKHRINPYAYEVNIFDDVRIMPGNVGVVTRLCGKDAFSGTPNDLNDNDGFLVGEDCKGVQKEVLKEGTHRLNPFIYSISIVNIQSQRHEFSGPDSITFLTLDGFPVSLEGTVEFNILPEKAPRLTHEIGNMEDILKKLILPSFCGFARIEGSKKTATEFIIGESRQVFQDRLEEYLKRNCGIWGISINSVLIRDIIVPQQVASIIRDRELAEQTVKMNKEKIGQAKSRIELVRQQMLAEQNIARVTAETSRLTAKISAMQRRSEKLTAAQAALEVAEVQYKTAGERAKSNIVQAEAKAKVIEKRAETEAEVLRRNVEAYGSPEEYVRMLLNEKLGPSFKSIMINSSADGGGRNTGFGLPLFQDMIPRKGGDVK